MPRFFLILFFILSVAACVPALPPVPSESPGPTGIAGRIGGADGSPATGVTVYAYRSNRTGLRGPADFAAITDENGDYFLDLVEGSYYLVARQRSGGNDAGPPRSGDAWAVYPRNPVRVSAEKTSRADLSLHGISRAAYLKEGSLSSGDTGYSGRLVDGDGRPLAGAIALAYSTPDHRRIPDYTAAPADADGRFVLFVPGDGRFCLAARTRNRGQPESGEPFGVLADGEAGCRAVQRGEIVEVGAIVLRPYRR